MVNVIKVYLQRPDSQKTEIRRLAVSSDTISKFELLCVKVIELFPVLCGKTFDISWKDSEGDLVLMSSDVELAQALANADDGLIKIYVHLSEHKQDDNSNSNEANTDGIIHKGVICDECNTQIKGHRYKCLECKDYDLCTACNAANKHPHHDMLKLVESADACHKWINGLFARRMWKTLFGRLSLHTPSPTECPFATPKPGPSDGAGPSDGPTHSNEPKWEGFHHEPKWEGFHHEAHHKFDLPGMFTNLDKFMKTAGIEVKIGGGPFGLFNPWANSNGPHAEASSKKPAEDKNDQAKSPDSGSSNGAADQSQAEKTNVPENNAPDSSVKETTSAADQSFVAPETHEEKEQSHVAAEGDISSSTPEGWTLLNKDDASKKTPERETTPLPAEKPVAGEVEKTQEDKPVKVEENRTEDPKIANALLKMRAMGFTNEGGWLERLLITKQGNINEALDALYPNTQRH